jgi:hypothetical protein
MTTMTWTRLRRVVASKGFTPATWIPAASEGRPPEAMIRPARVIERGPFAARPVGVPEPWPGMVAFLDGTQRYEVMSYASITPVVVAEVAAAIMERRERRLQLALEGRRRLVIARPSVLHTLGDLLDGHETVALPEDHPAHPVQEFQLARRIVDQARGRLEVEIGHRYREHSSAWLIVDGSLTDSPLWACDPRMLSVAKNHATLPFGGEDLQQYLHMPAGSRSPLFAPPGNEIAPVYSWGLRMWPSEGRDTMHGLIRIEAAPTDQTVSTVDQLSRWLLAERAPVSTPDPRWDRMLYGLGAVEEYLRSSGER